MKGDLGLDTACPLCGSTIHPRYLGALRSHYTTRQIVRRAVRQHLTLVHLGMSIREMSLACDAVCASL